MSGAVYCLTYPPSLFFKRASCCWKFWLAYIHLHFLSGNNTAPFRQTEPSPPYLNMALSLCSVLCSELASERIFYLHVPCLLPGRLTEVSSDVHVWSPVVPPWHPALTFAPLVSISERCSAMMRWCKCEDVILILTCFFKKNKQKNLQLMSGNKSFGFHFTFALKLQTGEKTQNNKKNSRLNFFFCFERLYVIFSSYSAMLHIAFFMLS